MGNLIAKLTEINNLRKVSQMLFVTWCTLLSARYGRSLASNCGKPSKGVIGTMSKQIVMSMAAAGTLAAIVACGSEDPSGSAGNEGPTKAAVSALTASPRALDAKAQFFVPPPQPGAVQQVANLLKSKDLAGAARVAAMALTPQAVWFQSGSPTDVQKSVKQTMDQAALERRVPVLVSYNIPFRDCAQYSAGGALDTPSYEAWIDGFAAGIGKGQAVVILEPDSIGIIPFHTNLDGSMDWCQPKDANGNPQAGASTSERFAQLNYAINSIISKAPKASVYLDGTHSAWLNVAEVSNRLILAGVQNAQGFFLNASNYQFTTNSVQYGTWISECIALGGSNCADQYWNGGPAPAEIATLLGAWTGVALSPFGQWSDTATDTTLNTSGINLRYANSLGTTLPTTHFVIDTSRNANGPMNAASYGQAPYNQSSTTTNTLTSDNWCNPPGAGLGLRPTANTGVTLVDAYLWVKTPGESDGSCDSAGGARAWDYTIYNPPAWNLTSTAAESLFDPLWGMDDPAAGVWFPQQALQLAKDAVPPLL